jgi:hypothetical protein
LRSLLNSHCCIIAFGEIVQNPKEWDQTGFFQSSKMEWLHDHEPVTLIEKILFRKYPQYISAVGFKLFYYHARDNLWISIWPYLKSLSSLRIIHVKRRNILKSYLSRKKALITNCWVNTSGSTESLIPIKMNYQDCLNEFITTRKYEKEVDRLFTTHWKMDVFYKELSKDYRSVMRKVQEFLDVPYGDVFPSTYKQSQYPLSQSIVNYWELKEKFKGTEWEAFFEE